MVAHATGYSPPPRLILRRLGFRRDPVIDARGLGFIQHQLAQGHVHHPGRVQTPEIGDVETSLGQFLPRRVRFRRGRGIGLQPGQDPGAV